MGLDTNHDCWHGPYSQFMRWRTWLAGKVGVPLLLMDGFVRARLEPSDIEYIDRAFPFGSNTVPLETSSAVREQCRALTAGVPIKWSTSDPISLLLSHSDCDGRIRWWHCDKLAIRLSQILRETKDDQEPEDLTRQDAPQRGCYDGMRNATKRFALGCLRAYKTKTDVVFR